ncbi:hypothetical protein VTK26DRAFT_8142 [Humicola hyalothermophila]
MTEKFKTALGQNFRRIRGHIRNKTAPAVNLDRGTFRFIDPASAPSRLNSSPKKAEGTTKEKFRGWWSRLLGSIKSNGRSRNTTAEDNGVAASGPGERKTGVSSQPDFLTFLNMDDPGLDREAQQRRAGSAGSAARFLGGLDLNFGSSSENPFSDSNAIAHTSAKPAPLAVGQSGINNTGNPFSDANAIPGLSATRVVDVRRSRGQSVSNSIVRQPSTTYYTRDSVGSMGSVATTTNQRNKFRSDPFDLERPELLSGSVATTASASLRKSNVTSSTVGTAGSTATANPEVNLNQGPRRPTGAVTRDRTESFTSKYSSGISVASLGDWSDPGPDVGPGASGSNKRASPMQAWRDKLEREPAGGGGNGRRASGGSQGAVGKAM